MCTRYPAERSGLGVGTEQAKVKFPKLGRVQQKGIVCAGQSTVPGYGLVFFCPCEVECGWGRTTMFRVLARWP